MANSWKSLCRTLCVLCGFCVENFVQKSKIGELMAFVCGKMVCFADKCWFIVGNYIYVGGKGDQVRKAGFITISTVST